MTTKKADAFRRKTSAFCLCFTRTDCASRAHGSNSALPYHFGIRKRYFTVRVFFPCANRPYPSRLSRRVSESRNGLRKRRVLGPFPATPYGRQRVSPIFTPVTCAPFRGTATSRSRRRTRFRGRDCRPKCPRRQCYREKSRFRMWVCIGRNRAHFHRNIFRFPTCFLPFYPYRLSVPSTWRFNSR